jgi:hypothetical protein
MGSAVYSSTRSVVVVSVVVMVERTVSIESKATTTADGICDNARQSSHIASTAAHNGGECRRHGRRRRRLLLLLLLLLLHPRHCTSRLG